MSLNILLWDTRLESPDEQGSRHHYSVYKLARYPVQAPNPKDRMAFSGASERSCSWKRHTLVNERHAGKLIAKFKFITRVVDCCPRKCSR
jgi:hypothetical protein